MRSSSVNNCRLSRNTELNYLNIYFLSWVLQFNWASNIKQLPSGSQPCWWNIESTGTGRWDWNQARNNLICEIWAVSEKWHVSLVHTLHWSDLPVSIFLISFLSNKLFYLHNKNYLQTIKLKRLLPYLSWVINWNWIKNYDSQNLLPHLFIFFEV